MPFRACDTPSERAEFKHPDAAIAKTHLAYYQAGLQEGQLREAMQAVVSLPLVQGEQVFRCRDIEQFMCTMLVLISYESMLTGADLLV